MAPANLDAVALADLGVAPDLSPVADAAFVGPPADLGGVPPDLASPPDLAPLPDLASPPLLQGVSDYRSIPRTGVTLPPAGASFVDPDFQTTIIRVTNASQAGSSMCTHSYAYIPAFNVDSTRLLLTCGGVRIYSFDPVTHEIGSEGTLTDGQAYTVNWESAFWSGVSPDQLYVLGAPQGQHHTVLYRVDVTKHDASRFTVVHNFAGLWPGTWDLWQLGKSEDDNVFTFHARGTEGNYRGAAYIRAGGRTLVYPDSAFDLDETQVDKLGRYVAAVGRDANAYEIAFWDLLANRVVYTARNGVADKTGGHYDLGAGLMVNGDRYETGVVKRSWDALDEPHNIFRYLRSAGGAVNWTIADHISMRNADESFFVVSTYGSVDASWPPFQHEIVLVKTDGSGFFRVAHTRSMQTADSYWSQPRAVIDRSGRFVVFASDNGTSRIDTFILRLP